MQDVSRIAGLMMSLVSYQYCQIMKHSILLYCLLSFFWISPEVHLHLYVIHLTLHNQKVLISIKDM